MNIRCPLCSSQNCEVKKTFDSNDIITKNNEDLGIDVSRFFSHAPKISSYTCADCKYEFYFPSDVMGDNEYYIELQKFPWYYMSWKWEYGQALKSVPQNAKVLEIGCGPGDFLQTLVAKNADITGLEFNDYAIEKCHEKNITVVKESVENYAEKHKAEYDVVCSFQVMEHIVNIGEAIKSSIDLLKVGGRLIIAVPNHDSFMKYDSDNTLNMPPHHIGLWNEQAIQNLPNFFPITLINYFKEPLQTYHYTYYYNVRIKPVLSRLRLNFIEPFIFKLYRYYMHHGFPRFMDGHTILAVYQKTK